jgi:hypothetical protein
MTTESATRAVRPVMTILDEFAERTGQPELTFTYADMEFNGLAIDDLPPELSPKAILLAYYENGTDRPTAWRVFVAGTATGDLVYSLDPAEQVSLYKVWDPTLQFTDVDSFIAAVATKRNT